MTRRLLPTAVALSAAAAGLFAVPFTTASASATVEPPKLVAMGDSWAAASQVNPADPNQPALCLRSAVNPGRLMAQRYGLAITDVTCGAAKTKDFAGQQYPWTPPQLNALTADTDYVTLNIGGNDNDTFVTALLGCVSAAPLTAYQGAPCKTIYGSKFVNEIRTKTYPQVRATLAAIHQRAPKAKVAIRGYQPSLPAVATPACQAKTLIAKGDFAYLNDIQATLNSVIRQAAADTGSIYVDMPAVSAGHDSCAGDQAWVSAFSGSDNLVPVHPTGLGSRAMADETAKALGLG